MFPHKRFTANQETRERNARLIKRLLFVFYPTLLVLWLHCLLVGCGDIHPNPGPSSSSISSSVSSLSNVSLPPYDSHLSICHLNIQSLLPKIDILQYEMQPFDIFVFTETWLNEEVDSRNLKIINFTEPFRRERCERAGGVAIYVKDSLGCRRRPDLEIKDLECVWVHIKSHGHDVLVAGMYRPPNTSVAYWNLIHESIDRAKSTNIKEIIILGDLNNDMTINHKCKKLNDLIQTYSLNQLITEPTHFTEHSSTLIDVILVTNTSNVLASEVCDPFIPNLTRFHCPIAIILKFLKPKVPQFKRKIWKYEQGDYNGYRQILSEIQWDEILNFNDVNVDMITDAITSKIVDSATKTIPNKEVSIRPRDPPWMHNELRKLIRRRKRIHKLAKRTNSDLNWSKFRRLRNKITKKVRAAKTYYESNISQKLKTCSNDIKTWWKLSKQILTFDNKTELIPSITHNNNTYETSNEKAELFNSFFLQQSELTDALPVLPTLEISENQQLNTINISYLDVRDVLQHLNVSKASGPDLINPRLLREAADQLSYPLSKFYNHLIQKGRFPSAWKIANVIPVFKKDDRTVLNNYRPISLLSILGKSLERCVHKYIYNYCISHRILTPLQSGFIHGDSTTYQLIDIYNSFIEAVDSGKEVRVVFCDISKAFDRVWHQGLLHKLKSIGISGTLFNWFKDYLENRKQRVVINGQASSLQVVKAGVPQGSILGPLLFLIYINDIVETLNCNVRLFADDTSLFVIVENPITAADILNNNLIFVSNWASQWLVTFNPSKTESMVITRRRNKPSHPDLIMNNTKVTEVKNHKHLGITFSSDCNWHPHIIGIVNKAWQRINVIRSFKFKFDRNTLERMYITYVRPILEYSSVVWDNCSNEDKQLLESVQIEAMRIVTGATKLCSIAKLYNDTCWETLQARRQKQKLLIFYKMVHGLAPEYLNNVVPPLVQEQSRYALRNARDVAPIFANTNLYSNSFLPSAIRDWNKLSDDIRNSQSFSIFKTKLSGSRFKSPSYYNYGDRGMQVYHARLRLGCSSLKSHLYSKNLIDSPLCTCGEPETVKHYLATCPNYTLLRNETLSQVIHLPIKTLLSGNPTLSVQENENIFSAIHAFLARSGRFTQQTL